MARCLTDGELLELAVDVLQKLDVDAALLCLGSSIADEAAMMLLHLNALTAAVALLDPDDAAVLARQIAAITEPRRPLNALLTC